MLAERPFFVGKMLIQKGLQRFRAKNSFINIKLGGMWDNVPQTRHPIFLRVEDQEAQC